MSAAITKLMEYFFQGIRPPPDLTISEWADQHRNLPRVSAGEPGRWRTSRTPYLKEIMDEMSPSSHADEIVVMKGSQVGFTECLINVMLYYMSHAPGPILSVQPTIGIAERFSKQRLQPSIDECEELKGRVSDKSSRDGGNTTLQKDFPGGTLILGGANSAAALRSMPIQILPLDEIDAYPQDVDGEGDPYELAKRRTTNFSRRKILSGSTPTIKDVSRIEKLFDQSDQRYFNVPCPFCNDYFVIKWPNIRWRDKDPSTVYLHCEKCEASIYERHKTQMLSAGKWVKTNSASSMPGFHISALYSPMGWYSWEDAVEDHLKSLGDPLKRKVWVNTVLAETWDDSGATIDPGWLAKRKEIYPADCPDGVVVLTCGVDNQDDRLECQVVGWGTSGESWVIDYRVIMGDPKYDQVWTELDKYLMRTFLHENGSYVNIGATCIDSGGHCTDEVYQFCARRSYRHVWPVKGQAGPGKQLITKASHSKRAKTYLFHVGVDQAKGTLYSRLKTVDPGPGYVHFPAVLPTVTGDARRLDSPYFEGLTAEKRIKSRHSGLPSFAWVCPPGKRNEPLDTYVYAMAALSILQPDLEALSRESQVYIQKPQQPARGRRVISRGLQM